MRRLFQLTRTISNTQLLLIKIIILIKLNLNKLRQKFGVNEIKIAAEVKSVQAQTIYKRTFFKTIFKLLFLINDNSLSV